MKISELKPFDLTEVLTDEEALRHYLALAFEDDDPRMIQMALYTVARVRGIPQVARDAGLTVEELSRALTNEGSLDLASLVAIIRALEFKLAIEPRDR